jgi:anti-sigma regulatory factor (Ser/Thr protein kinase)
VFGNHRRARWDLPHHPTSAAAARRAVRSELAGSGFGVHDVELMVTELVTNAVRHARPPISVQLDIEPQTLRVEVLDGGGPAPVMTDGAGTGELGATSTGGRGLVLVDALADTWGVDGDPPGGKGVWFQVGPEADTLYHSATAGSPTTGSDQLQPAKADPMLDRELQAGDAVELWVSYTASWSAGFEVVDCGDQGYRVKRSRDGTLMPGPTGADDIRLRRN